MKLVVPAILTDDFQDLQEKIRLAKEFGAKKIQIDIADNHFFEGKTIGVPQIAQIRSEISLEYHFMVQNPNLYLEAAKFSKPETVIIHTEPLKNPAYFAKIIKSRGSQAGLAINPETSISEIKPWLKHFDIISFLSVRPGRQGNKNLSFVLEKIARFKKENPEKKVSIDGGWNSENIQALAHFDINEIVVGSGIWKAKNPEEAYKKMCSLINWA